MHLHLISRLLFLRYLHLCRKSNAIDPGTKRPSWRRTQSYKRIHSFTCRDFSVYLFLPPRFLNQWPPPSEGHCHSGPLLLKQVRCISLIYWIVLYRNSIQVLSTYCVLVISQGAGIQVLNKKRKDSCPSEKLYSPLFLFYSHLCICCLKVPGIDL